MLLQFLPGFLMIEGFLVEEDGQFVLLELRCRYHSGQVQSWQFCESDEICIP